MSGEPANGLQNPFNYLHGNVNERDSNGDTPLHLALRDPKVNETVIKQLLDASAQVNARNNDGKTPLHRALLARNFTIAIIKLLLDRGADLKILDMTGDSPLMCAVTIDNCPLDVIKFLIERGADMHEKDAKGDSVLKNALKYSRGRLDILKLFLEKGADINAREKNRNTLLHIAAYYNLVEVAEFMLKIPGIKVDLCNKDFETPLFAALKYSDTDPKLVRLLLKAGANVRKQNKLKKQPLHLAAIHCNPSIIKLLLDYGALVYVFDKRHFCPIYNTVNFCNIFHRDVTKMLLDYGAYEEYQHSMWYINSSMYKAAYKYMEEKENNQVLSALNRMEQVRLLFKYSLLEEPQKMNYQKFLADEETTQVLRDFGSQCLQELQMVCVPPHNISLQKFILNSRLRKDREILIDDILDVLSANAYPLYKEVVSGVMDRDELKYWFQLHSVTTVSQKDPEEFVSLDYDTLCEIMIYLPDKDLFNLMLAIYNPKNAEATLVQSSKNVNGRLAKRARKN